MRIQFQEIFTNQKYYIIEKEDKYNLYGDNGYTGWVQDPENDDIIIVYYTKVGATNKRIPISIRDKRGYIKSAKINSKDL